MNSKHKVKRVKTVWGKLCFVREEELNDSRFDRLLICNQFGGNKKMPKGQGMFEYAPLTVYRENLDLA